MQGSFLELPEKKKFLEVLCVYPPIVMNCRNEVYILPPAYMVLEFLKFNLKKMKKFYHVLEVGSYGEISYQGYEESMRMATKRLVHLSNTFIHLHFEIYVSDTNNVPPIITL